jgi:hypothetical protein
VMLASQHVSEQMSVSDVHLESEETDRRCCTVTPMYDMFACS